MSFTFSIEGIQEEHGYELPCKGCGVSTNAAMNPEETRHHECRMCDGYGGAAPEDMPVPQFELNVANINGYALLRHLGIQAEPYGEADPQDILTALALRDARELNTCGRDAEQVAHYIKTMERIATKAAKYGRKVVWG